MQMIVPSAPGMNHTQKATMMKTCHCHHHHHPLRHLHHFRLHLHLRHLVYHLTFPILMEDYEYFYKQCNNNITILQQVFSTLTLNGESNDDYLIYHIQNALIIVECNEITFIICSHVYGR